MHIVAVVVVADVVAVVVATFIGLGAFAARP